MKTYHDGRVTVHGGDCLAVLAELPADSFDAVVTDPPYHFASIVKRFGADNAAPTKAHGAYKRHARGFMNQKWDGGQIAHEPTTWAAVLRVLKPGGHMVAFGAPKNYHRLAVAVEDAGFEIRDTLLWLFGSGFPKSHNVGKAIDRELGAERTEVVGTKLGRPGMAKDGSNQRNIDNAWGGERTNTLSTDITAPVSDLAKQYNGFGTALKPAFEPVLWGTKPVTVEQHFAILLSEVTAWLNLGANVADEPFTASLAKWQEAANSVLDSAKIRSLASIGIAPSAALSFTFAALASIDRTETRACSALSHVRPSGSEDRTSAPQIQLGEAGDILTEIMVMSTSVTMDGMSSNTASSWARISDAIWNRGNTFTIETAIRLTIALRTSISSIAQNIFGDTGNLYPSFSPIVLARRPLVGTIAANVMQHGTGALNIDACRVGGEERPHIERRNDKSLDGDVYGSGINGSRNLGTFSTGRWPANVCHDGSDEVVSGFPEQVSGGTPLRRPEHTNSYSGGFTGQEHPSGIGSTSGSAARFFYTAKADADDRLGSKHPTVKPLDLMQWLVRLVTPPGGHVLDPFAGTGTTAEAALREGFRCTLIEREAEYLADIDRRMVHVFDGEVGRSVAVAKTKPDSTAPAPLLDYIEAKASGKQPGRRAYGKFARHWGKPI